MRKEYNRLITKQERASMKTVNTKNPNVGNARVQTIQHREELTTAAVQTQEKVQKIRQQSAANESALKNMRGRTVR